MKAYSKTIFRMVSHNKGRFLANFFICLISVFVSSGLAGCPDSFEESYVLGYDDNPPDLIVKSTGESGLTEENLAALKGIEGYQDSFSFFSYDFSPNDDETYYRVYLVDFADMGMAKPLAEDYPAALDEVVAISGVGEYEVGQALGFDPLQAVTDSIKEQAGAMAAMFAFPEAGDYKVVSIATNSLYRCTAPETAMIDSEEDRYVEGVFYLDRQYLSGVVPDFLAPMVDVDSFFPYTDCYLSFSHEAKYMSEDYDEQMEKKAEEVKSLLGDAVEVLTLQENTSYAMFDYYNDKVRGISLVIPFFFIVICALINLITMQRLMKDERSEIGCYASLGFQKRSIAFKFLFFAFFSAATGCLAGYLTGTPLLPLLLYPAYDSVFRMGEFAISFFTLAGILIAVGVVLVSLFVTTYIALAYLREVPAELLKEKAPKPGKKIYLERIKPLWKRISFSWKSSLRNIFRQKKNLILTTLSVIGGTVIVMLGFALNDASSAMVDDPLFGRVASSMGSISAVIILLAIALAVTVIYSLANMNIEDRKREIATLKVLGYHNVECSLYTFREIIFIVILASILGVGVGTGVVYWAFDFLQFGELGDVQWYSYLASPILIIIATVLVNLLLSPHIAHIDMNSSLKQLD